MNVAIKEMKERIKRQKTKQDKKSDITNIRVIEDTEEQKPLKPKYKYNINVILDTNTIANIKSNGTISYKELTDQQEDNKYYKEKNEMIRQIKGLYLAYRDTFVMQKVYNIWQICDSCFNKVTILSANKKAEYKGNIYIVIEVEVS